MDKSKLLDLMNKVDSGKLNWTDFKIEVLQALEDEINTQLHDLNNGGKSTNKSKINDNDDIISVKSKKEEVVENKVERINNKDYENIKPLVEIKSLTKQYKGRPNPAINKITFNIYPGEFHAFIGANGAGKTTTIKSIVGAYTKQKLSGKILINGKDYDLVESKRLIGYIPENAKFPPKMNLYDYLYTMTRLSGYKASDAKERVEKTIKELNLESLKNKRPNDFSSGQKKRVLLAQALVHNPSILIMDEPAANLDPLSRIDLFDDLIRLENEGKAIFISSHILDEIGKYATYCTILDGGEIVFNSPLKANDDLSRIYRDFVKKGSVDTGIVTSKR